MKKKICFALFVVTALGLVATERLFNRLSGAQEAPKAEPEAKKDLFAQLKQELEAKKVPPPVIPPPSLPAPTSDAPTFPPLRTNSTEPQPNPPATIPPPTVDSPQPPVPVPGLPIKKEALQNLEIPAPAVADGPAKQVKPPVVEEKKADVPIVRPTMPMLPPANPDASTLTPGKGEGSKPTLPDSQPLVAAKADSSPWALHVEVRDGQTIVTATVHKKHAFKVVCQSLDLQTGKGTMKALGKVQISGDMLSGECEQLAISLMDDRLLLEGGAEVRIQKSTNNVSDTRPAAFELKGQTLNLRISDFQAGKLVESSWRKGNRGEEIVPASLKIDGDGTNDAKKWTPYGRLRRAKIDIGGEIVWCLEDRAGKEIAYLVARDGGTLTQYEGRMISVFGLTEQIAGRSMLRVTHIAAP